VIVALFWVTVTLIPTAMVAWAAFGAPLD